MPICLRLPIGPFGFGLCDLLIPPDWAASCSGCDATAGADGDQSGRRLLLHQANTHRVYFLTLAASSCTEQIGSDRKSV